MAEYFEISILFRKKLISNKKIVNCLRNEHSLSKGKNNINIFGQIFNIIVFLTNDTERDYILVEICIENYKLTPERLEIQLIELTDFVKKIQVCTKNSIEYCFCAYELSSYFLNNILFLDDINEETINKFPVVIIYKGHLDVKVNYNAQYLF